jgi:hypothetical protein
MNVDITIKGQTLTENNARFIVNNIIKIFLMMMA